MPTKQHLIATAFLFLSTAACVDGNDDLLDDVDPEAEAQAEAVERQARERLLADQPLVVDQVSTVSHRGVRADPYEFMVVTSGKSNAGTSATVTLTWIDDFEKWSCTIKPSSKSTAYSCVPEYKGFTADTGYFEIENPSTDGLNFTEVWAFTNDTNGFSAGYNQDIIDTFHELCEDCSGIYCGKCWVDRDNESCGEMRLGAANFFDDSHSYSCRNP